MLSADRPDITGPLVLAGSPLSYWAGVDGSNPMRYRGGLLGGVWMSSFFSDLGNGTFDGANLVLNMELLNPANTIWTKQYNLYRKIDTEEARFLNFEKWWGGFFCMTSEEIHFIVDSLFVGNKLEQGMTMEDDSVIDLKNLDDPVVVFASQGDNITPPQQALNWIVKVYGSIEEIKRQQQVMVYMVHKKIGHLGIFVASSVAKKEHKEIIGSMDMIDYLEPGLYEMVIEPGDNEMVMAENRVRFEERTFDDIMTLDDGMEDELDFEPVAFISEVNDSIYKAFFSPMVKMATTEFTAEFLRQLHPLRIQRYPISDLNPMMLPIATLASMVRKYRKTTSPDNIFVELEKSMSTGIESCLNFYRDIRDLSQESVFKAIYGSPIVRQFFSKDVPEEVKAELKRQKDQAQAQDHLEDEDVWLNRMTEGGFAEGVTRIMLAMAGADHIVDKAEYIVSEAIVLAHPILKKIRPADFKKKVKEQSRILQTDQELAIDTLVELLKTPEERAEAFEIAEKVAMADKVLADEEKVLLDKIKQTLEIQTQE